MICRDIVDGNVIWFGSKGKNLDGTAIFDNDEHTSYASGSKGVAASLTERLSVIKEELWFDMLYGLPLIDKIKSKAQMDLFITKNVLRHPDVTDISSFSSELIKNKYTCSMVVNTVYGEISLII